VGESEACKGPLRSKTIPVACMGERGARRGLARLDGKGNATLQEEERPVRRSRMGRASASSISWLKRKKGRVGGRSKQDVATAGEKVTVPVDVFEKKLLDFWKKWGLQSTVQAQKGERGIASPLSGGGEKGSVKEKSSKKLDLRERRKDSILCRRRKRAAFSPGERGREDGFVSILSPKGRRFFAGKKKKLARKERQKIALAQKKSPPPEGSLISIKTAGPGACLQRGEALFVGKH